MEQAKNGQQNTGPIVAYVCQQRDYLRELLTLERQCMSSAGQDPPVLAAVLQAVTATPFSPDALAASLATLDEAVLAAGDMLGIRAAAARGLKPVGINDTTPYTPRYLCPLGRCTGRRPNQTTVFPMTCAITGRDLEQTLP